VVASAEDVGDMAASFDAAGVRKGAPATSVTPRMFVLSRLTLPLERRAQTLLPASALVPPHRPN
jgi:hypothetical protein